MSEEIDWSKYKVDWKHYCEEYGVVYWDDNILIRGDMTTESDQKEIEEGTVWINSETHEWKIYRDGQWEILDSLKRKEMTKEPNQAAAHDYYQERLRDIFKNKHPVDFAANNTINAHLAGQKVGEERGREEERKRIWEDLKKNQEMIHAIESSKIAGGLRMSQLQEIIFGGDKE